MFLSISKEAQKFSIKIEWNKNIVQIDLERVETSIIIFLKRKTISLG